MFITVVEVFVNDPHKTGKIYPEWKWTHPTYTIQSNHILTDIIGVEIDPSLRMADVDRKNNKLALKW